MNTSALTEEAKKISQTAIIQHDFAGTEIKSNIVLTLKNSVKSVLDYIINPFRAVLKTSCSKKPLSYAVFLAIVLTVP